MSRPGEERWALLAAAGERLQGGRAREARRILRQALSSGDFFDPEDETTFYALRLLGQASRQDGDLGAAGSAYETARSLAVHLGQPKLESIAVEGLALVANADNDEGRALVLYDEAAALARRGGDPAGAAAVLNNKGGVLLRLGRYEEAKAVLDEALACEELIPSQRAAMEDNLSEALAEVGEIERAIETGEGAAAQFEAAGLEFDRYLVLQRLEQLHRKAGEEAGAVETFTEAYALIHELESRSLEPEHYRLFAERSKQIEAQTTKSLEASGVENVWLDIGFNAMIGDRLATEGEELFESGEYEAAERSLLQALAHWEHLEAQHEIPRVQHALGMVYSESGQLEKARAHLVHARDLAHQLGDAFREEMACANLCKLALGNDRAMPEIDPLRLVARARALRPISTEQRFSRPADADGSPDQPAPKELETLIDPGVLDSLATSICLDHGALELADEAATRSARVMERWLAREDEPAKYRYRLALRLVKVYAVRRRQKRDEEAEQIAEQLEELKRTDDSPRTAFAINSALGRERFDQDQLDAQTLELLRGACDAFERMRRSAGKVGDLAEYSLHPPFGEAIEVSIRLGLLEEALHLLERSKARSLLDALRDSGSPDGGEGPLAEEARLWREVHEAQAELDRSLPGEESGERAARLHRAGQRLDELEPRLEKLWSELEETHPDVVSHRLARPATTAQLVEALGKQPGDPLLIELFVGPRGVHAFTLDATGELSVHRLGEAREGAWADLRELVRDKRGDGAGAALETLRHPALQGLAAFVASVAADRPVFLVPHQALHSLPLHLVGADDEPLTPRPRTFHLSSASLLRYGGDGKDATGVVVGGDPLGDLPFAALEAETVATRFGTTAATGSSCTAEWLASELPAGHAPVRLLHLACHSVLHPSQGDRSGLMLAGHDGPALASVRTLATLDWQAELVVLSACSSGQHEVRDGDELAGISRALLGQGAGALIVALWNVPDLATYLLVSALYERLPEDAPWSLDEVGAALAAAQVEVRDLSARSLLERAIALHETATGTMGSHCALASAAAAHRAAGNRPEWLRAREAVRCLHEGGAPAADIGSFEWRRQAALAGERAYSAQPFADPVNWAAFVLSGSS